MVLLGGRPGSLTIHKIRPPDSLGNRKNPLSTKSAAFEISTTSREAAPNAVETRSEFRYTSRAATRCSRPTPLGRRRWSSLRSHPPHGNRVPWLHKISALSSPSRTDRPCSSNGRGFAGIMGIIRFPRDAQGDGERSGCLKMGHPSSTMAFPLSTAPFEKLARAPPSPWDKWFAASHRHR